ncbi:molybdenum cofactor biosynthesis protein 1 isoform X2 [Daktulosphaira vitifoliae]|nr:molybdenum cofactor biosynthesis protein 1 isoform X2 [Daktulosphaira vitifoliae]
MPVDGAKLSKKNDLLTNEEMLKLVSLFVKQGINKVRITGGEPTVRKDIVDIVRSLKELNGLRTIAMTTNGLTLTRTLVNLQRAGLNALNISLDTLQSQKYEKITRRDGGLLKRVLVGIDLALQLGFNPVKVNCVLMRKFNLSELCDFVEFTRNLNVDYRFIEFMPFAMNKWDEQQLVPYKEAVEIITKKFPNFQPCADNNTNATSKMFKVPEFKGRVGFITSMTDDYCDGCNRLRLMADGNLKACLFQNNEISLRNEESFKNDKSSNGFNWRIGNLLKSNITRKTLFGECINLYSIPKSTNGNIISIRQNHSFTHIDPKSGKACMVNIVDKLVTRRTAVAEAIIKLDETTVELIDENLIKKGDVLGVAQIAGICAAKKTWELIPLCHQLKLDGITVDVQLKKSNSSVKVTSSVVTQDRTGVEMEALTACTIAALVVYDMCKAVNRNIVIEHVKLISKTGGKNDFTSNVHRTQ